MPGIGSAFDEIGPAMCGGSFGVEGSVLDERRLACDVRNPDQGFGTVTVGKTQVLAEVVAPE